MTTHTCHDCGRPISNVQRVLTTLMMGKQIVVCGFCGLRRRENGQELRFQ